MRIPRGVQLDRLLDERAAGLPEGIWLRGDGLEALTTYAAVRLPVERTSGDVDGPVPPLALQLARELGISELKLTRGGALLPGVARFERPVPDRAEPPTFVELVESRLQGEPRKGRFAVNPRLLARAAAAIGAGHGVIVEVRAAERALHIRPNVAGARAEAIVMPVRISR
jgi:hypothetical protein